MSSTNILSALSCLALLTYFRSDRANRFPMPKPGTFFTLTVATIAIFLVSACQRVLLILLNVASLSIDVDVPNKALFLTYEFESPLRAVQFYFRPERARRSSWSVLDSEIDWNGNVLSRTDSKPFQTVTIKVGIDRDSTDRGESALSAMGDVGLVLSNAYLALEGIPVTDITAKIARGEVVVHGGFVSNVGAEKVLLEGVLREVHYVYFGDPTMLSYVGNSIIVSSIEPENNALLVIRNNIEPAMQWIDTFFGLSRQDRQVIIVSFDENDDMDYVRFAGRTTLSGDILLSFEGDSAMWESRVHEDSAQLALFHELVHSAHFISWRDLGGAPFWLVQGLADYLAITYAHSVGGYQVEQTFLSEIEHLAGECLNILETGNFGISRASAQVGATIYDECGVLALWLIDGRPRMAHRADRLSMVLARMKDMPGAFRVGKLRRAMETGRENEAWEPLQMLIEGPGGKIWQWRDQVLQQAGIGVPDATR